jgi:uncharacterized protein (DUF1501 family)
MKTLSRRDLLNQSATILALAGTAPLFWRKAAQAFQPDRESTILVVLELTGGNDGLNTVVPYRDDVYHRSRRALRVEPSKVLKLDGQAGLHPALKELKRLWDKGHLAIVQGVGYPDPDRSHFRSMEIWQTGALAPAPVAGWLGRAGDLDPKLDLCHVGQEALPLALQGRKAVAQSLASVADYHLPPGSELPAWFEGGPVDPALEGIRRRYRSAAELASRLEKLHGGSRETIDASTLEGRLATIGSLIRADTPFRVFYTSLSGFDTHASQLFTHAQLLQTLATGVTQFLEGLDSRVLAERVIVLIFSEFGRRLQENASSGTDHGTAAPLFIAGSRVKGGLLGRAPSLAHLDETGDPRFTVDFRDVYASVLGQWLHIDPVPILGERNGSLPFV